METTRNNCTEMKATVAFSPAFVIQAYKAYALYFHALVLGKNVVFF